LAKCAALVACGTLGVLAALDPPFAHPDPPVTGDAATVFVTQTIHVDRRVDGLNAREWRGRAIVRTKERDAGVVRRHLLERELQRARGRWAPTVSYAISLASRVFGVDEGKMRAVAWCESTWRPWASNGRYKGLFKLGWSPFGFSPYDPVANALSTAQTVVHDGSWRQWACG